jgi:hypothetical protein
MLHKLRATAERPQHVRAGARSLLSSRNRDNRVLAALEPDENVTHGRLPLLDPRG